jgi:hypothetical protein
LGVPILLRYNINNYIGVGAGYKLILMLLPNKIQTKKENYEGRLPINFD